MNNKLRIEQLDAYRKHPYLNYSKLKDYIFSPSYYYKKHVEQVIKDKTTDSMDFGSLCHTLILTPELFDDFYYIGEKSTPSVELLLEKVYDKIINENLDLNTVDDDFIYITVQNLNIFNNIKKKDTLVSALLKLDFYTLLIEKVANQGKTKITAQDYTKALNIKDAIANNIFLERFNYKLDEFCDVYNEYPVYTHIEINGVKYPVKILIDKFIISHRAGTVSAYDLKVTHISEKHFLRDMAFKYRYDLQCALYTDAIKEWIKDHELLSHYTFEGFKFVVVNAENPESAVIFHHTDNFLHIGRKGNDNQHLSLIGYEETLESINWANKNNHWVYSKKIYENKAQMFLDC